MHEVEQIASTEIKALQVTCVDETNMISQLYKEIQSLRIDLDENFFGLDFAACNDHGDHIGIANRSAMHDY
jgi:hypothetical protein